MLDMAAVAVLAGIEGILLGLVFGIGALDTLARLVARLVAIGIVGDLETGYRSLGGAHHFPGDAAMGFLVGAHAGEEPGPALIERRRCRRGDARKGVEEIERAVCLLEQARTLVLDNAELPVDRVGGLGDGMRHEAVLGAFTVHGRNQRGAGIAGNVVG